LIFEFVSDFDIRISDFSQATLLILSTIILLRHIRDTTIEAFKNAEDLKLGSNAEIGSKDFF